MTSVPPRSLTDRDRRDRSVAARCIDSFMSIALAALATWLAHAVAAPVPEAAPVPGNPTASPTAGAGDVQSPEIHPDGRVTFRLHAPGARAAAVRGEWTRAGGAPNAAQPMTRRSDGIWSVTVGPVEP